MLNQINETRTFGVEIEFVGVSHDAVCNAIQAVGIECRVESYHHNVTGKWKVMHDGSVYDTQSRYSGEVVSPILKGVDGLNQLEKVCDALNLVGARVNWTCGLHVHHDAGDYTQPKNFQSIYNFYKRFEPVFDSMMPNSRRGVNAVGTRNISTYCKSFSTTPSRGFNWLMERGSHGEDPRRYYKLNFQAFYRHGTIEFRQHSGTTEFLKIKNWVILTQLIVEKCRKRNSKATAKYNGNYELFKFLGISEKKTEENPNGLQAYYRSRMYEFKQKENRRSVALAA